MPVIGLLKFPVGWGFVSAVAAFRAGLAETGYVEGRNVVSSFAGRRDNSIDFQRSQRNSFACPWRSLLPSEDIKLPVLRRRRPPLSNSVWDRRRPGQRRSGPQSNRPGGNTTGATFSTALLGAKRLGVLRQLVPEAKVTGLLVNQNSTQGQGRRETCKTQRRSLDCSLLF